MQIWKKSAVKIQDAVAAPQRILRDCGVVMGPGGWRVNEYDWEGEVKVLLAGRHLRRDRYREFRLGRSTTGVLS